MSNVSLPIPGITPGFIASFYLRPTLHLRCVRRLLGTERIWAKGAARLLIMVTVKDERIVMDHGGDEMTCAKAIQEIPRSM